MSLLCRNNKKEAVICKHCGKEQVISNQEIELKVAKEIKVESEQEKDISALLGFGILFLPYIFSWVTLQKRFSTKFRIISFSWLAFIIIGIIANNYLKPTEQGLAKIEEQKNTEKENSQTTTNFKLASSNNDLVSDTSNNLVWMRCSIGQNWNGSTCNGDATFYSFEELSKLNNFSYAGYTDWRLPTLEELKTLVNCENGHLYTHSFNNTFNCVRNDNGTPEIASYDSTTGNIEFDNKNIIDFVRPTIIQYVFPKTPKIAYWSSTPFVTIDTGESLNDTNWGINFNDGGNTTVGKQAYKYNNAAVRLVRNNNPVIKNENNKNTPLSIKALNELFGKTDLSGQIKTAKDKLGSIWFEKSFKIGQNQFHTVFIKSQSLDLNGKIDDCHVCTVMVGAVTYQKINDEWKFLYKKQEVSEIGSWGDVPLIKETDIIILSYQDKLLLLIPSWDGTQGYVFGVNELFLFNDNEWKYVGHIFIHHSNMAADICINKNKCFSYDGKISLISSNKDYPDLLVTKTPTKTVIETGEEMEKAYPFAEEDEEGNIVPAKNDIYVFNGERYEKKLQAKTLFVTAERTVLDVANDRINAVWNGTTKAIRKALLLEQRAWLKQRESNCSFQEDKIHCMAEMTDQRTEELKQKIALMERNITN